MTNNCPYDGEPLAAMDQHLGGPTFYRHTDGSGHLDASSEMTTNGSSSDDIGALIRAGLEARWRGEFGYPLHTMGKPCGCATCIPGDDEEVRSWSELADDLEGRGRYAHEQFENVQGLDPLTATSKTGRTAISWLSLSEAYGNAVARIRHLIPLLAAAPPVDYGPPPSGSNAMEWQRNRAYDEINEARGALREMGYGFGIPGQSLAGMLRTFSHERNERFEEKRHDLGLALGWDPDEESTLTWGQINQGIRDLRDLLTAGALSPEAKTVAADASVDLTEATHLRDAVKKIVAGVVHGAELDQWQIDQHAAEDPLLHLFRGRAEHKRHLANMLTRALALPDSAASATSSVEARFPAPTQSLAATVAEETERIRARWRAGTGEGNVAACCARDALRANIANVEGQYSGSYYGDEMTAMKANASLEMAVRRHPGHELTQPDRYTGGSDGR